MHYISIGQCWLETYAKKPFNSCRLWEGTRVGKDTYFSLIVFGSVGFFFFFFYNAHLLISWFKPRVGKYRGEIWGPHPRAISFESWGRGQRHIAAGQKAPRWFWFTRSTQKSYERPEPACASLYVTQRALGLGRGHSTGHMQSLSPWSALLDHRQVT